MKKITIKKITIAMLFVAWFFLPATIIPGTYHMLYEKYSPDKKYKVRVFCGGIISPISLYKYLAAKNYFFIIYDKDGNQIYKPSPYYGTSNIGAFGDITFIYGDKHSLFFPGADGTYDAYDLPE